MTARTHIMVAATVLATVNFLSGSPPFTPEGVVVCLVAALLPDLDNRRSDLQKFIRAVLLTITRREPVFLERLVHRESTHSLFFLGAVFLSTYFLARGWCVYATLGIASHLYCDTFQSPGWKLVGYIQFRSQAVIPVGSREENVFCAVHTIPLVLFLAIVLPSGGSKQFMLGMVGSPAAVLEYIREDPEHLWDIEVREPLVSLTYSRLRPQPAGGAGTGLGQGPAPIKFEGAGPEDSGVLGWFKVLAARLGSLSASASTGAGGVRPGTYRFVAGLEKDVPLLRSRETGELVTVGEGPREILIALGHLRPVRGEAVHTATVNLAPRRVLLGSLVRDLGQLSGVGVEHHVNGTLLLDREVRVASSPGQFSVLTSEGRILRLRFALGGDGGARWRFAPEGAEAALVEEGALMVTFRLRDGELPQLPPGLAALVDRSAPGTAPGAWPAGQAEVLVPFQFRVAGDESCLLVREGDRVVVGQVIARSHLLDGDIASIEAELRALDQQAAAIVAARKAGPEELAAQEALVEARRCETKKRVAALLLLEPGSLDGDPGWRALLHEHGVGVGVEPGAAARAILQRVAALRQGLVGSLEADEARLAEARAGLARSVEAHAAASVALARRQGELGARLRELKERSTIHATHAGEMRVLRVQVVDHQLVIEGYIVVPSGGQTRGS